MLVQESFKRLVADHWVTLEKDERVLLPAKPRARVIDCRFRQLQPPEESAGGYFGTESALLVIVDQARVVKASLIVAFAAAF